MSILTTMLKAKEPLFSLALKQLEDQTQKKGVDARLIADILHKGHDRMRQLGLDPADTTGEELYYALISRVKADNSRIAKRLGAKDPDDLSEMLPLIVKYVQNLSIPKDCWVLRTDVARLMLLQTPPKNIMRRLGYKKIDAMLEKENIYEIYAALRFAENADWLNQFNAKYHTLTPEDFETREIEIINFDAAKWGDIAEHFIEKKLHNITHLKELGVIITMPVSPDSKMTGQGVTLKVLPLLLHYFNEVRLYSAFFKLIRNKKNFGELISDTLIADTPNKSLVKGNYVGWRVIQRYYGKLADESHPEIFEPHVQPEDLHWRKAEEVLYLLDSELKFWENMDYVGLLFNKEPVTFNLMDVALGYANKVEYRHRYLYHFRESLWNEVFIRYLGQKTLEERILMRLDNEIIQPEQIPIKRSSK